MTMRVTITRAGASDSYGRPLLVGTTYTVTDEYGRDLVQQQRASDTDGVLQFDGNDPFLQGVIFGDPPTLPAASLTRDEVAAVQADRHVKGQIRAAAIGDSILFVSGCAGWFEYACALSGGRMMAVRNAGVNGNTSTQMAARFATDIAAYSAQLDLVFLFGNVNNIGAAITTTQLVADYTAMIQAAYAVKLKPVVVAAPPYNTNPGALFANNYALRVMCKSLEVDFYDPWSGSVDPATGNFVAGYATDTTTHPGQTSHRLAGASLASQMGFAPFTPRLPLSNVDSNNKISNGLFLTGGATPTGWSAAPAEFVYGVTAGSGSVAGNWFDMAFTALTNTYRTITGPISMTGIVPGDTVRFAARLKSSGFEANGAGPAIGQGKVDVAVNISCVGPGTTIILCPSIGADIDGIWETVAVIPAGTTSLQLRVNCGRRGSAPNVNGTFSIAQMALTKE